MRKALEDTHGFRGYKEITQGSHAIMIRVRPEVPKAWNYCTDVRTMPLAKRKHPGGEAWTKIPQSSLGYSSRCHILALASFKRSSVVFPGRLGLKRDRCRTWSHSRTIASDCKKSVLPIFEKQSLNRRRNVHPGTSYQSHKGYQIVNLRLIRGGGCVGRGRKPRG